jgi:hypothetical protein
LILCGNHGAINGIAVRSKEFDMVQGNEELLDGSILRHGKRRSNNNNNNKVRKRKRE